MLADYLYELNMMVECGGFRFEGGNFKGKFVDKICRNKTKLRLRSLNRAKLPDLEMQKAAALAAAFGYSNRT